MKPSLLFISHKWPPAVGGMETHAVELAETLRECFEVTLLVLPGRPGGQPPSLASYGWFLIRATMYCLLHGRKFEHLVLGDLLLFPAAICNCITRKRQRRVVLIHGLDLVYGKRSGLLPALYVCYFWLFRTCQELFCGIIANSTYTAELAVECGLRDVYVINPTLPTTKLTTAAPGANELPTEFARAQRRILQFGRLVPRKGALWFALNVLPRLPDDVVMFVAGPPTDHGYVEALEQCKRTCYLGSVPVATLTAMIQTADAVVMPNVPSPSDRQDVEGFGLVAIETSALGGILVASRWQGMTDAVIDQVTGVLVEPGDADVWQRTLQRLLDEPIEQRAWRREMARLETRACFARQRAADQFAKTLMPPPCEETMFVPTAAVHTSSVHNPSTMQVAKTKP